MSLSKGKELSIRSTIYVAAAPIPFFWPMRSFIHHNPLHGLEEMPFDEALQLGEHLFHGRAYLPRKIYQGYAAEGKVDRSVLAKNIARYVDEQSEIPGINLNEWLIQLLDHFNMRISKDKQLVIGADLQTVMSEAFAINDADESLSAIRAELRHAFNSKPLYEIIDKLYGTRIGEELDELVIKSCLDFYDEGQSVWKMPSREQGLYSAWRDMAMRSLWPSSRVRRIKGILSADDTPEGIIAHVMHELKIPEEDWKSYFTAELTRLHGWSGFIRWRESAKHYHWTQKYPGDLVDFLAIRLTLSLALIKGRSPKEAGQDNVALTQAVANQTCEMYLRHEFYTDKVMPVMAYQVEQALATNNNAVIEALCQDYIIAKREKQAQSLSRDFKKLAKLADNETAFAGLSVEQLDSLLISIRGFELTEGMHWLQAMEGHAMKHVLQGLTLVKPKERDKRPFVQGLFCIDTRSERIRRHLESAGDYETYGIAGFFGVPISFMELGKGGENHLCPVLLTPKNLVLEMTLDPHAHEEAALMALEHAMHDLKESVLTPFVTVEAIGLLFGFDMVGKTMAPRFYQQWRKHIEHEKPDTHLLVDKLSKEQADSIVRAVQRALIVKALEQEFNLPPERITDNMIRDLRECALNHQSTCQGICEELQLDMQCRQELIEKLRTTYLINESYARSQMEKLSRIGFSLDEQAGFVGTALRAIGLTKGFSRFVLLVGHGSTSQNNPYESALDCGACGGDHGLVNARVLAQMANKRLVRKKLRKEHGITIDDDAWFVPAMHNTTTDKMELHDLELLPSSHLIYIDRLRTGLVAASRLCAQERMPTLLEDIDADDPVAAFNSAERNSVDWSQVRPEWGLSKNVYFIVGRRDLTKSLNLDGRAFLHSYDYQVDSKRRMLENIMTGPLVVGQWINMEHYFSAVDNERFGSGSKVYHNVAGRFGVMTGNLSDLRTGLPSQTVLDKGLPYHEPMRLITAIEAPFDHAWKSINAVASVKRLVRNDWIRMIIVDPETHIVHTLENGEWYQQQPDGWDTQEDALIGVQAS